MQATSPTIHVTAQPIAAHNQLADPRSRLGPIGGAVSSAVTGAVVSITVTACALLGEKILQAAGNNSYNLPPFVNMLVPAIVGTSVLFGGMGFLAGMCNPDRETM